MLDSFCALIPNHLAPPIITSVITYLIAVWNVKRLDKKEAKREYYGVLASYIAIMKTLDPTDLKNLKKIIARKYAVMPQIFPVKERCINETKCQYLASENIQTTLKNNFMSNLEVMSGNLIENDRTIPLKILPTGFNEIFIDSITLFVGMNITTIAYYTLWETNWNFSTDLLLSTMLAQPLFFLLAFISEILLYISNNIILFLQQYLFGKARK